MCSKEHETNLMKQRELQKQIKKTSGMIMKLFQTIVTVLHQRELWQNS